MPAKPPCVLVLDVGKTNKKVALYDRDFHVLAEARLPLGTADWNGLEVERTGDMLAWFRERLRAFAANFDIRAISVTAHGATLALLDESGRLAMPVVSYTASVGHDVQDEFYEQYGARSALLRETGSADIGFCNMAKVLHYVRTRRSETWARVRHGLFYASYFAYELTGMMAMEPTFIGNHSYLWDFARNDWSRIARDLGAHELFAKPMRNSWDALGPLRGDWARDCGVGPDCVVAAGIHDSNANLLPYLARERSDFVLASTGTWCVLMRPVDTPRLTDAQVDANVFFNLSATRKPVLTGLLPAGMEYETFASFSPHADAQDFAALNHVVSERRIVVVPGTLPDVPLFPGATPGLFVDRARYPLDALRSGLARGIVGELAQQYFAALNASLAIATQRALAPLGAPRGATIYIEGGFAANEVYCRLLATLCPQFRWVRTHHKEGTSFGAAVAGWAAAERVDPNRLAGRFKIESQPIPPLQALDVEQYSRAFAQVCGIPNG